MLTSPGGPIVELVLKEVVDTTAGGGGGEKGEVFVTLIDKSLPPFGDFFPSIFRWAGLASRTRCRCRLRLGSYNRCPCRYKCL